MKNIFKILGVLILVLLAIIIGKTLALNSKQVPSENFKSIFHSIWWAIATLTTVGYGDVYPITIGGKIFSSIIILIGIGIVAIPTGLIASSINKNIKN